MDARIVALVAVVVAVVSAAPLCHAQAATTTPVMLSPALPYSVLVALERMHFSEGDNIVVREVRGAVASLEPGMTYAISGTYTLSSHERAAICAAAIPYGVPTAGRDAAQPGSLATSGCSVSAGVSWPKQRGQSFGAPSVVWVWSARSVARSVGRRSNRRIPM